MAKNYFCIILLVLCFCSLDTLAQENKQPKTQDGIEGLSFYPNPVSNGKIFINSKSSLDKDVSIFDVLGKLVFQTVVSSKELNVSSLTSGVYIIKIKEGENTTTRKLIIK